MPIDLCIVSAHDLPEEGLARLGCLRDSLDLAGFECSIETFAPGGWGSLADKVRASYSAVAFGIEACRALGSLPHGDRPARSVGYICDSAEPPGPPPRAPRISGLRRVLFSTGWARMLFSGCLDPNLADTSSVVGPPCEHKWKELATREVGLSERPLDGRRTLLVVGDRLGALREDIEVINDVLLPLAESVPNLNLTFQGGGELPGVREQVEAALRRLGAPAPRWVAAGRARCIAEMSSSRACLLLPKRRGGAQMIIDGRNAGCPCLPPAGGDCDGSVGDGFSYKALAPGSALADARRAILDGSTAARFESAFPPPPNPLMVAEAVKAALSGAAEPEDPVFVIPRRATEASHAGLLRRAVSSIRAIYPGSEIVVIDDGSDQKYSARELEGGGLSVLGAEWEGSGEMGALRYVMDRWKDPRSRDSDFVIMHDSMVLTGRLPSDRDRIYSPLYHFDKYHLMHLNCSLHGLSLLELPNDDRARLVSQFIHGFGESWTGCFGISAVLTPRFLREVNAFCGLLGDGFMSWVNCRERRQACERIAAVCMTEALARLRGSRGAASPARSLCGNIFDHPGAFREGRLGTAGLDEILSIAPRENCVFKTWVGR